MSDDQQTGFAGLEPMEGGWSGRTFLAEAGGERTVVRVYDPDDDPYGYEKPPYGLLGRARKAPRPGPSS